MAYVVRTALPSGTLARSALAYEKLHDAVQAAGDQIKKGFAVDAWVETPDGGQAADISAIKRACDIS